MAAPKSWLIDLMALCAWREASGEGNDGMRAVLWVIWNRSVQDKVPVDKVICGKNQFSSMTILGDGSTVRWPVFPCDSFLAALGMATNIVNGTDEDDPTHGAYYYANLATENSKWFENNVIKVKKVLATIGRHTFYER